MDDIQEESAKYGSVKTVIIPRPSKDGSHMPGVGKVFVKYGTQVRTREKQHNGKNFIPPTFASVHCQYTHIVLVHLHTFFI